ncbi:MAG TPA: heavy metal-binding domain-containing protein, partial [Acidimicrobiales bacterium]|nr:heavy metal-binding domain-containing protein [Acidimicrobiales bacterium]
SLDEELALHAAGWEPVDLVCGISLFSVPSGIWTWGQGEIGWASNAFMGAFAAASRRIHEDCRRAGGHGVVGVRLERAVHRHHVEVALEGTAVRPVGGGRGGTSAVFLSDLSGRDFSLLEGAGWTPLGLAAGASFVYAPRRSMGTVVRQTSQNVELTNFTEALYAARETAMERMQHAALDLGGTGVVEVKVTEGPVDFASHAVGFAAYGTAVRQRQAEHRPIEPQTAVPLDDAVRGVEATSLRGG